MDEQLLTRTCESGRGLPHSKSSAVMKGTFVKCAPERLFRENFISGVFMEQRNISLMRTLWSVSEAHCGGPWVVGLEVDGDGLDLEIGKGGCAPRRAHPFACVSLTFFVRNSCRFCGVGCQFQFPATGEVRASGVDRKRLSAYDCDRRRL